MLEVVEQDPQALDLSLDGVDLVEPGGDDGELSVHVLNHLHQCTVTIQIRDGIRFITGCILLGPHD